MKTKKQIQIDIKIWQQAKVYCAENNLSLKQFVEELIGNKLGNDKNISSN